MTLALNVPWYVGSLLTLLLVGWLLGITGAALTALVLTWLASGALTLWRPVEEVLGRWLFGLRRPTPSEAMRLDGVWPPVAGAARLPATGYSLRVQESQDVNAAAVAGHTIVVTRWAVQSLPPHHLAAVLAHELGHHVGGHAWANLLSSWYSLPGRLFMRGLRAVVRVGRAVFKGLVRSGIGVLVALGLGLVVAFVALYLVVLLFNAPWAARLVLLLALVAPFALAWSSRNAELYADRIAARLGYGPALVDTLQNLRAHGYDDARARSGLRGGVLAAHPTCGERIEALEKELHPSTG